MDLDKLNRGTLLHKIEKIEDKLELRKDVLETFAEKERDIRGKYNLKFQKEQEITEKDEHDLAHARDMRFRVELEIFLAKKQIELIKEMLINNEVTEF
ncbi:MAG: hypothetical protein GY920_12900 [Aliivibrio sp.]|jgi:hypothetical protein|nr:hypothetical protein [Aliivibrio sp.]